MSEEGHVKDVNITAKSRKYRLSKILVDHNKVHFGSHQSLRCIEIVFLILPQNRSVNRVFIKQVPLPNAMKIPCAPQTNMSTIN